MAAISMLYLIAFIEKKWAAIPLSFCLADLKDDLFA
jgi:hypothetical protein